MTEPDDFRSIENGTVPDGKILYRGVKYRKAGDLKESDAIMNRAFWIGVYPGLTKEMLDYVISMFCKYFRDKIKRKRGQVR
jgi:dTDP-4-amino-4,6-dideoxygalactose transaminase